MLWTIVLVLLILWLLGGVALPTVGGLIHLLLVLALIALVVQLFSGRRVAFFALTRGSAHL
ncbi:MAG: lmo0937 family membrane protein [Chloroflexota bacterium]